ncbi:hypothetical protein LIER_24603 [Lithospermum erythrorhizon]|uniref:C2 domain-containing protein n=1 Tax=Lithospermum erythrorhizon TaxID=34254 RepID=A0AAV3R4R2_LITER
MANGTTSFRPSGRAAPPPPPPLNHRRPPPLDDAECDTILTVEIYRAENIDKSTKNLDDYPRIYTVFGFVDAPENEFTTQYRKGGPNPQWFEKRKLKLENYEPCNNMFLHLEVIRVSRCMQDPGTSRGVEVVGRTKISLPEIGQKVVRQYALTIMENGRVSSKPRGHIVVGLEMDIAMRQRKRYSYSMY